MVIELLMTTHISLVYYASCPDLPEILNMYSRMAGREEEKATTLPFLPLGNSPSFSPQDREWGSFRSQSVSGLCHAKKGRGRNGKERERAEEREPKEGCWMEEGTNNQT